MSSRLRVGCRIASRSAAAVVLASAASAAPIAFGVGGRSVLTDCATPLGIDCLSGSQTSTHYGAPGTASVQGTDGSAGLFATTTGASLSGGASAPILSTSATSTPTTSAASDAFALQAYTYTGGTASLRTITGTLTFSQSGGIAGVDPVFGQTRIVLAVYAGTLDFSGTTAFDWTSFGVNQRSDAQVCARFGSTPGCIAAQALTLQQVVSDDAATVSVAVNLAPGQTITVFAWIQSWGEAGGFSDAANTFVTSFDDTAGLVPGGTALPEPQVGVLLAASAGVILLRTRRPRRHRAQSAALGLALALALPSAAEAATFSYQVDRWSIDRNGVATIDEFDDGVLTPPWNVVGPTAVESAGLLTLSNPGGIAGSVEQTAHLYRSINLNGFGSFVTETTWLPKAISASTFISMSVLEFAPGLTSFHSLVIRHEASGLVARHVVFSTTGTPGSEVLLVSEMTDLSPGNFDLSAPFILRAAFDDATNLLTLSFRIDGTNFVAPFSQQLATASFGSVGIAAGSVVPEPHALALMALGGGGLLRLGRRRSR